MNTVASIDYMLNYSFSSQSVSNSKIPKFFNSSYINQNTTFTISPDDA